MIRSSLESFAIYSRRADGKPVERKNLGTFVSREAAEKHERACWHADVI